VYSDLGDRDKALHYYNQALVSFKQLNNQLGEANCLLGLGEVYSDLGAHAKAIDYFTQAAKAFKDAGEMRGAGTALHDIGEQYYYLNEMEASLDYYDQALKIFVTLDNSLRYVPMAALFDREKYLIENYQNVVFTRTDTTGMLQASAPVWTGFGFGSSQAQTIDLLGDKNELHFPAIPGAIQELQSIFGNGAADTGILAGTVFTDKQFSMNVFYEALKQHRPLVHIASHFSFRPGDDSRSFLLLGNSTALTLNEMKKQEKLFAGVELLTLSACNTAATQADSNGKEIDGFAELAQRLGAASVLATLWPVSDHSTFWLMKDFYRMRQGNNGATKAEALRRAQLALLNGTADVTPLSIPGKISPNTQVKVVVVPETAKRERILRGPRYLPV
jgi:CHAT domain-containing protein